MMASSSGCMGMASTAPVFSCLTCKRIPTVEGMQRLANRPRGRQRLSCRATEEVLAERGMTLRSAAEMLRSAPQLGVVGSATLGPVIERVDGLIG